MANRNKLDRKGRPFRKLNHITYIGMKYYKELRLWSPKLPSKGNLKLWFKAGLR